MAESKMMGGKKQLVSILVLLLLAALTLFALSRSTEGLDAGEVLAFVTAMPPVWLALAAVSALSCILVEGCVLRHLCARLGYAVPLRRGAMWAAADYYISGITPLATGGQPAAAYFMQKDGVPLAKSTLLLVFNTMQYQASLLVLGIPSLAVVLLGGTELPPLAAALLAYGFSAMTLLLVVCILCMTRRQFIRRIGGFFIKLFAKVRLVKDGDKALAGLDSSLSDYADAAGLIGTDPAAVFTTLGLNVLQRTVTALPVCCFALGLGFPLSSIPRIFALNILCVIGSAAIPIPGTVGVAELIFELLFLPVFEAVTPSLLVVNRLLVFYLCVLVGGVWTWARMVPAGAKKKKE